jgi:hypothetical protein
MIATTHHPSYPCLQTQMDWTSRWQMIGVNACYGVNKKLSQFDNFQYMWNFDISWWMFGKHFVTKKFNQWWFTSQYVIVL